MPPPDSAAAAPPPELSVVIPVYNEEAILRSSVVDLCEQLDDLGRPFEIILSANGCHDRTVPIARELSRKHAQVRYIESPEPNYGKALRAGILDARGTYVLCDEIDLCDADFHRRALAVLDARDAELVVGSKVVSGAADKRPAGRRAATRVINLMLRVAVGFRGTDTHGLKAFSKDAMLPIVRRCELERDLFASEMVIRAWRDGLRVVELPVEVVEKRKPSINLMRRVPRVLSDLARLTYTIRVKG
ncbi:MAG TPA: glycosyltransferase family 2 protein [Myxococcota bacterium]|jgi:glycosyltransferase involved in cell wall biosynthesis|nr:glycosyltransferase family 2 protein [Myxococcota bacterium]